MNNEQTPYVAPAVVETAEIAQVVLGGSSVVSDGSGRTLL